MEESLRRAQRLARAGGLRRTMVSKCVSLKSELVLFFNVLDNFFIFLFSLIVWYTSTVKKQKGM